MKYARLSTIQDNIKRSKSVMVELKRQRSQTGSRAKELLLKDKIDDERAVLSKLEKAYSEARSQIKARRV